MSQIFSAPEEPKRSTASPQTQHRPRPIQSTTPDHDHPTTPNGTWRDQRSRVSAPPFAIESDRSAGDSQAASTADLDVELLALNSERDTLLGELNKAGPTAGRTLADRRAKAAAESRLTKVEAGISQIRRALRARGVR